MPFRKISINKSFSDADFETTLVTVRECLLQESDVMLWCQLSDEESNIAVDHLVNSLQQLTDKVRELTSIIKGPQLETGSISVRLFARNFRADAAEAQIIQCLLKSMRRVELAQGVLTVRAGGWVTVGTHRNQQEEDWRERLERKLISAWEGFVPTIVEKTFAPQRAPGMFRLIPIPTKRWMKRTVALCSVDELGQASRMRLVTSSGLAVMDMSALSALSAVPYERPSAGCTEIQAAFRIVADDTEEGLVQEQDISS
jgi:hypothetical protein